MSDIPPINEVVRPVSKPQVQEGSRVGVLDKDAPQDQVEISDLAKLLSELQPDSNSIRVDKVMAIREAIANGTYETEEKIQATIDRLLEDLRSNEQT